MGFELDNKITIDSVLTMGLAIVFIIQTMYLAKQTNVGVRLNQATLRENWDKKLGDVKIDLLIKNPNNSPDEKEFERLVNIFNLMRPFFRSKLLKPSDFAHTFIVLSSATKSETLRKSKIYEDKYFILQHIFSHFNKDYDMINYQFDLPNTSWYNEIFQEVPYLKAHPNTLKFMNDHWPFFQRFMKIRVIYETVIRRKPLFRLEPPL